MTRHLVLAAAALGALAACDKPEAPGGAPSATATATATAQAAGGLLQLVGDTPSSISKERPEANTGDDPKAEFRELVEVKKAKDAAKDRSVLIRGYAAQLREPGGWVHLFECEYRGDRIMMQGKFTEEQLALVRGMPSHKPNGPCPRIHVKLTGFDEKFGYPQGEIVDVYDVQPDPLPVNLPDGVDFIAMDDLFLRGSAALGKVADMPVRLGHKEDKAGVTYYVLYSTGCSPHGGWNAHFFVPETDATRAALATIPKSPQCMRVRLRIKEAPTEAFYSRWGAELIGIADKPIRAPEPTPNP